jgi:fructuronate reductase
LSPRLSLQSLALAAPSVRRPRYDPAALGVGILHLGLGAFHRAHQAAFTDDAIEAAGGAWGICAISLRRPDAPQSLAGQDGLFTLELRGERVEHRIIGAIRRTATAPLEPQVLLDAFASPDTHLVTLTVTEKGYALDPAGLLDLEDPDVAHDLRHPLEPRSTIGWVCAGLGARKARRGGAVTILSCDNLSQNGRRLEAAVRAFASASDPGLEAWIADQAAFPCSMVDSITPASTPELRARVEAALGLQDQGCVQREAFAQWVIEDRFAAARPAWEAAGAELAADVEPFERLKLHVLNAAHSALAYLGLPRSHALVREAVADQELAGLVEAMVLDEVAPALEGLPVGRYWRDVKARFANPNIDHRLSQISDDGSRKLAQRIFPIMIANVRAGRPAGRLATVVRGWLALGAQGRLKDPQAERLAAWGRSGARLDDALDDPALFPPEFRSEPGLRLALAGAC